MATVNGFIVDVAPYYYGKMGEDGLYMAVCHIVTATDRKGNIFVHNHTNLGLEKCLKLVDRIEKTAAKDWDPSDNDNPHWAFFRRSYGSEAYCDNEAEERDNDNRLDFDSEYGPGAFDEAKHRGTLPESLR